MALSQKHEGKSLVPWFCSGEWRLVYDKIFGKNSNESHLKQALDILSIWKSRTPLLPQGVEGTYIILQAILLDKNAYDIYELKLLFSTSIMRFLNLCGAHSKYQDSFYETAIKMNIPEWLVNLRHDVAHGQNLPSLDMLERALKFCLEWLHHKYWRHASSKIKDFIDNTQFDTDRAESLKYSLQPFISHYCYLTLLTHPHWNYNIIEDIPDEKVRKMFLREIKNLIHTEIIDENSKLDGILAALWKKSEEILKNYEDLNTRYHILAELIVEDIFISNFEERHDVFGSSKKIPIHFINIWLNMFMKFTTEMVGALIEKLVHVLTDDTVNHECKVVAATWILEIGKGLEKCIFIKNTIKECEKTGKMSYKNLEKIIEEKLRTIFKKKVILNFRTNLEIPMVISDYSLFKPLILENPNDYTNIFLSQFLNLNEILKVSENKANISELLNIYLMEEDDEIMIDSIVHTIEEFEGIPMDTNDQNQKENNGNISKEKISMNENKLISTKWRKVTEINFEKCPIGILPWQSSSVNPLLPHLD